MTTRNAWRRGAALVLGVAVCGFGGTATSHRAAAQTQDAPAKSPVTENPSHKPAAPSPPRTLDEAVAQLDSDEWAVRDMAERWLLRQPAVVRPDIEEKIDEATDYEVTFRLKEVALHLYLKGLTPLRGKASMLGISLGLESLRMITPGNSSDPNAGLKWVRADQGEIMSVAVLGLQPGFPAAEVLQVGDRIVGMEGQPFGLEMSIDEFRARINALEPGKDVELMVVRGKEELKLPVRLAGVPEGGGAAMNNYVAIRQTKAKEYTAQLDEKIKQRDRQLGHTGLTVQAKAAAPSVDEFDNFNGGEILIPQR